MTETVRISIDISAELGAKLARLAELGETSRDALAAEALQEFVERELELAAEAIEVSSEETGGFLTAAQIEREMPLIQKAIAEADSGLVHAHEDVMAEAEIIIAEAHPKRHHA